MSVNDFADSWLANLRHNTAKFGKSGDGKRAVNQFIAKSAGASGIVFGDEGDDFFQIVQRLWRDDYFAAHASTSLRASSAGIPSRRRACSRAVWMPASSSTSRAISGSDIPSGNLLTNSMIVSRLLMLELSTAAKEMQVEQCPLRCY